MARPNLTEICGRVSDVAERADVEAFVVGATANVAKCRLRLGAEDVVPIYEANGVQDASEVENALIERFSAHPRCGNEPHREYDDSHLANDDVISVYVAVWWKDSGGSARANQ
jgi:hypothetical protein